jgi:hypothetical protein
VWFAADEVHVDRETGEVYKGPDREASAFIKQETGGLSDNIGMKATEDPQIMEVARQHGLTVEQWMERNKPSDAQVKAKVEADAKVVTHRDQDPKPEVETSTLGGFNDADVSPIDAYEAKKRGRPRKG